ncbi:12029_t:CDS:2 [Gigaspora margarita]|uniref:12029_t:CDS:1 n=1 Tax=Gigaspora margarita TaxID=4874 RepID=A0ABN7UXL5_GIGMA|nr:12029_t:CDS:2 [Gigaspora margarita]
MTMVKEDAKVANNKKELATKKLNYICDLWIRKVTKFKRMVNKLKNKIDSYQTKIRAREDIKKDGYRKFIYCQKTLEVENINKIYTGIENASKSIRMNIIIKKNMEHDNCTSRMKLDERDYKKLTKDNNKGIIDALNCAHELWIKKLDKALVDQNKLLKVEVKDAEALEHQGFGMNNWYQRIKNRKVIRNTKYIKKGESIMSEVGDINKCMDVAKVCF